MNFHPGPQLEDAIKAFEALDELEDDAQAEAVLLLRGYTSYLEAMRSKFEHMLDWLKKWDADTLELPGLLRVIERPLPLDSRLATPEVLEFLRDRTPSVSMEDILKSNPSLQSSLERSAKMIREMQGEDDVPSSSTSIQTFTPTDSGDAPPAGDVQG